MIAVIVNTALVLLGGSLGLFLGGRLKEKYSRSLVSALALCVAVIGIMSAIKTQDMLAVIICLVLGTILGELINIEDKLVRLGDWLQSKVHRGSDGGRFTEGFVSCTLLFCVGSMAVVGSLEAGINGDYSIIFSKSIIDAVTAVSFAAALGVGVLFSSISVFIYQGSLTLLAVAAAPYLSTAVVTEMSAVGGVMIIGIAINMLNLGVRIRAANMLPAIILPVLYLPFANWIGSLF